jgi:hypothetical protein
MNLLNNMEVLSSKQLSFPSAWLIVSLAIVASLCYLFAPKNSNGKEENGNVKLEAIPGPKRESWRPFVFAMIW